MDYWELVNNATFIPFHRRENNTTQQVEVIQELLSDICLDLHIPIIYNSKTCRENGWWGYALGESAIKSKGLVCPMIEVAPERPPNPTEPYQLKLPPHDQIPRVLAHELSHILFDHYGQALVEMEFDAELTSYLFCKNHGLDYFNDTVKQLRKLFNNPDDIYILAKQREDAIYAIVTQIEENALQSKYLAS